MKKYRVTIQGVTPLLMNRPDEIEIDLKAKERKVALHTKEEQAKSKLYELNEKLYQPSTHIEGSLLNAGKYLKIMKRGSSKATYSKVVGSTVSIEPFAIEHKFQDWEIFSISGVNPNTRGRSMIHRPILKKWELTFDCIFDEEEIPVDVMQELFNIAGKKVGIGDWRPDKKGKYGKFMLTEFKEIK